MTVFLFACLKTSLYSAPVRAHFLVTIHPVDQLFSAFKGSRLLDILPINFVSRLAVIVFHFQSTILHHQKHRKYITHGRAFCGGIMM